MNITSIIKMDLYRKENIQTVYAVQGDTARNIEFVLYNNGLPYIIPSNSKAVIRYKRADNISGIYDTMPDGSPAYNYKNNSIVVSVEGSVLSVPGHALFQVAIIEKDTIISTFTVAIVVQEDPSSQIPANDAYINIIAWSEEKFEKFANELRGELNEHAAYISENFCYVAEDDGDGNVTIRPFHLGGFTDENLIKHGVPADAAKVGEALAGKAPAGFGLGGTFSKVYSWDEADSLVVPGWYLVDAGEGQRGINGEQMMGVQLVRVDGEPLTGTVCLQTWVEDATRAELRREYNSNTKKWGDFYSVNPRNIPGRICATNEFHGGFRVYSVLIDVGTVNAGSTVGIELGIEAHKAFLDIVPYARYRQPLSDMSGAEQSFAYYGGNKIHAIVSTSAMLDDADNDGEVDTITGYKHCLNIENSSDVALEVRCLLKYTDDFAWE